MLRGRFGDSTGRPYLEGRLVIPRLGIDANVSFLVDTGADCSLIAPADGFEMGLDYSLLGQITESIGTGGVAQSYTEKASIAFTDPGKQIYVYHVDELEFAVPREDLEEMPPSWEGRSWIDGGWSTTRRSPTSRSSFGRRT